MPFQRCHSHTRMANIQTEFCDAVVETINTLAAAVIRRIESNGTTMAKAFSRALNGRPASVASPVCRVDVAEEQLYMYFIFPEDNNVLTLWSLPGHGVTADYATPDMVQAVQINDATKLMADFNYTYSVLEHLGHINPDTTPRAVLRGYITEVRRLTAELKRQ